MVFASMVSGGSGGVKIASGTISTTFGGNMSFACEFKPALVEIVVEQGSVNQPISIIVVEGAKPVTAYNSIAQNINVSETGIFLSLVARDATVYWLALG